MVLTLPIIGLEKLLGRFFVKSTYSKYRSHGNCSSVSNKIWWFSPDVCECIAGNPVVWTWDVSEEGTPISKDFNLKSVQAASSKMNFLKIFNNLSDNYIWFLIGNKSNRKLSYNLKKNHIKKAEISTAIFLYTIGLKNPDYV